VELEGVDANKFDFLAKGVIPCVFFSGTLSLSKFIAVRATTASCSFRRGGGATAVAELTIRGIREFFLIVMQFSPSIFIVILVSTPFDSIPLKSVCREPSDGSHPKQSLQSIGSIIVLIVTVCVVCVCGVESRQVMCHVRRFELGINSYVLLE
jgi:hypothetical protein